MALNDVFSTSASGILSHPGFNQLKVVLDVNEAASLDDRGLTIEDSLNLIQLVVRIQGNTFL